MRDSSGIVDKNWEFEPENHIKYMTLIIIIADIRLKISVECQIILLAAEFYASTISDIFSAVMDQKLGFARKNHIKYMIFIVILADIRLRISVDLQNYTDRRRILCSIHW